MTLDGTDLLALSEAEAREIRGARMAMIFQDPMRSLNPVLTIGRQLTEVLHRHQKLAGAAARTARDRTARDRRHTDGREAARRLSPPVLRRHAPARDDRHRALLQSAPADRRRGDDGARRHHPGADHRPGEAPDARTRHVGDLDQPRSRRGRRPVRSRQRHVCRDRRRDRGRSASCSTGRAMATRWASWARRRGSTARVRAA